MWEIPRLEHQTKSVLPAHLLNTHITMSSNEWKRDLALLLPPSWERKVDEWLDEDIPSFDYGGFVVGKCAFSLLEMHSRPWLLSL